MSDSGMPSLSGDGRYDGHFQRAIIQHIDRTSRLELSPQTNTGEVLHNSVLWLYDHVRPILEANPKWAKAWNHVTPDEANDPAIPNPDPGGADVEAAMPGQRGVVTQAIRRRQRRVLMGCLMDVGVLRTESISEAHLDGWSGTVWDLPDDDGDADSGEGQDQDEDGLPPGIRDSSTPDYYDGDGTPPTPGDVPEPAEPEEPDAHLHDHTHDDDGDGDGDGDGGGASLRDPDGAEDGGLVG